MSSNRNANEKKPASVRGRIRIRLTREGLAYLVVVLFVAAAAILRNINLLILLNGLMIAPLLLSWRLSRSGLRRLEARRVVRPLLVAGRMESVFWELHNRRRYLPGWQISITDRTRSAGSSRRSADGPVATVMIPEVDAGATETGSYRIRFPRRGKYWLGPAEVFTTFPFGLIRASFVLRDREPVIVAPAIGELVTGWDRRLMSHAAGDEAIKRRAGVLGDEFFAVRPWRHGDSLRHLHWRSTARHNRPMVRQFDRRSDRDIILVLDLWHPATAASAKDAWTAELEQVEKILSFAASVVIMASKEVHGRVSVAICGATNELEVSAIEAKATGTDVILERLALAMPGPQPDLTGILQALAETTPGGSPVYVVTNRPDTAEFLARSATYADPALAELQPWLRFLSPGREEFDSLFRPQPVVPLESRASQSGAVQPSARMSHPPVGPGDVRLAAPETGS